MSQKEPPTVIQAVDAFGKEPVEKIYPDWEFRQDFEDSDFMAVAEQSNNTFTTDGEILIPGEFPIKEDKHTTYKAKQALKTFGLKLLSLAADKGVVELTRAARERHERKTAKTNSQQKPKSARIRKNDPFLSSRSSYNRLVEEHHKHNGQLVVALDYDNTIFDYHSKGYTFKKVIRLIRDCNAIGYKVVIFSGSANERHKDIRAICKKRKIKIDGINTDLIDWHHNKALDWSRSKIYYNILLDDRAGLKEAYKILRKLVTKVIKKKLRA